MKTASLLFSVYTAAMGSRRLLQTTAAPLQLSPDGMYLGAYGQECGNVLGNFECTTTADILTDQGSGKVECPAAWSCCLCNTVYCGYDPNGPECDGIMLGAPYALYGVQKVALQGKQNEPSAVLDCGALRACANTKIMGQWLAPVKCSGPYSCEGAVMDFEASSGIICAGTACVDAVISLPTNIDGDINCAGPNACKRAQIGVNHGVEVFYCHGTKACKNAVVEIHNPQGKFHLSCEGDNSCDGLELKIIVDAPEAGCAAIEPTSFIDWAGVSCGGNSACVDMKFTVENKGCYPIMMEDLKCQSNDACTGAVFDLHAHTTYPVGNEVFIKNCLCGPSCALATGIDKCYQNLRVIQCTNPHACTGYKHVENVANDFMLLCSAENACNAYSLDITVTSASNNLVKRFAGFEFTEANAGENAVINIHNQQVDSEGNPIELVVEQVLCAKDQSCAGMVFITGPNVLIEEFTCASAEACQECLIKTDANDVGIACYIAPPTPLPTTGAPVAATTEKATTSAAPVVTDPRGVSVAPVTTAPVTSSAPVTTAPVTTAAPGTNAPVTTAPAATSPMTTARVITEAPVSTPASPVTTKKATPSPLLEPVIPIEPIPEPQPQTPVPDVPQTGGSPAPPQPDPVVPAPGLSPGL